MTVRMDVLIEISKQLRPIARHKAHSRDLTLLKHFIRK